MPSKIINPAILAEEGLKELRKIPELADLSAKDNETLESVVLIHAEIMSELPFLDGIAKKNAEQDLKHAKGALLDIRAINRMEGREAVVLAFKSVFARLIKIALGI